MKRSLTVIIILGVLLILIGNLNLFKKIGGLSNAVSNPVQIAFYAAGKSIQDKFSALFEIGDLRQKNSTLEERVTELEASNAKLQKLGVENETLKAQLGVTLGTNTQLLPAQVLGFTPLVTRNLLNLDKGTSAGVKKGSVVVLKDILMGRIDQVGERTSTVELLSDPDIKVLAETQSKARGIVTGEFGSKIKLTRVLLEETLNIGDYVYTSGEENFPKGLVIGKIAKIQRLESELFQEAEVEPLFDLNKLEVVFIRPL